MQQRSGTRASLWQLTLELDLWQDDEYPPDFSDETHTDAVLELHFWDRVIEDEVFEAWPAGEGTCWERMLLFIRKAWQNIPCSHIAVSSVRVLYRLFKDKASMFLFYRTLCNNISVLCPRHQGTLRQPFLDRRLWESGAGFDTLCCVVAQGLAVSWPVVCGAFWSLRSALLFVNRRHYPRLGNGVWTVSV